MDIDYYDERCYERYCTCLLVELWGHGVCMCSTLGDVASEFSTVGIVCELSSCYTSFPVPSVGFLKI